MDVSTPNNNQESNSGLLFVGQQLSERRLAKGLSQEQLADRMHLGIEQLAALESGDRDKLPELVFIKAMVRRLSTHLELDADALVASLGSLSDSGGAKERVSPAKRPISLPPQPTSRPEREVIWTWLVVVGAAAIGALEPSGEKLWSDARSLFSSCSVSCRMESLSALSVTRCCGGVMCELML